MDLPGKKREQMTAAIGAAVDKAGGAVAFGVMLAGAALLVAAVALILAVRANG